MIISIAIYKAFYSHDLVIKLLAAKISLVERTSM